MIAIVHSIYSQSVHALALNAGSMDNDAGRYCMTGGSIHLLTFASKQETILLKSSKLNHDYIMAQDQEIIASTPTCSSLSCSFGIYRSSSTSSWRCCSVRQLPLSGTRLLRHCVSSLRTNTSLGGLLIDGAARSFLCGSGGGFPAGHLGCAFWYRSFCRFRWSWARTRSRIWAKHVRVCRFRDTNVVTEIYAVMNNKLNIVQNRLHN